MDKLLYLNIFIMRRKYQADSVVSVEDDWIITNSCCEHPISSLVRNKFTEKTLLGSVFMILALLCF